MCATEHATAATRRAGGRQWDGTLQRCSYSAVASSAMHRRGSREREVEGELAHSSDLAKARRLFARSGKGHVVLSGLGRYLFGVWAWRRDVIKIDPFFISAIWHSVHPSGSSWPLVHVSPW